MKHFIKIFTILITLVNLNVLGQTGIIKGQVYDRKEKQGLALANVWLIDTKIGTVTDQKGNFKIDNLKAGIYNLKVSYIGYGDTTLYNIKVLVDTVILLRVELPADCIYDKNEKNRTCPICGKKNKVVPIVYGLPIGSLNLKKYYYAGCVITNCDPNWYCKRCKNKF
ncbi:MAG: carboxypeptidase-like regulatory domain-containing protein [Saprospiraceae bacterium]|nr:carboxypeptidase-like regulatory domain-containing protein [Saprospiraceae bacterium]